MGSNENYAKAQTSETVDWTVVESPLGTSLPADSSSSSSGSYVDKGWVLAPEREKHIADDDTAVHDAGLPVIQSVTSYSEVEGSAPDESHGKVSTPKDKGVDKRLTAVSKQKDDEVSLSGDESDCLVIDLSLSSVDGGNQEPKNTAERTEVRTTRNSPMSSRTLESSPDVGPPQKSRINETHSERAEISTNAAANMAHGIMGLFGLCSESCDSPEEMDISDSDSVNDHLPREPSVTDNAEPPLGGEFGGSNSFIVQESSDCNRTENSATQQTGIESLNVQNANETNVDNNFSDQEAGEAKGFRDEKNISELDRPNRDQGIVYSLDKQPVQASGADSLTSQTTGGLTSSPNPTSQEPLEQRIIKNTNDHQTNRPVSTPLQNNENSHKPKDSSVKKNETPSTFTKPEGSFEGEKSSTSTVSDQALPLESSIQVRSERNIEFGGNPTSFAENRYSAMSTPTVFSSPDYTMAFESVTSLATVHRPSQTKKIVTSKAPKRTKDKVRMVPSVKQGQQMPTIHVQKVIGAQTAHSNPQTLVTLPNFMQIGQPGTIPRARNTGPNIVKCIPAGALPRELHFQGHLNTILPNSREPSVLQPSELVSAPKPPLSAKFTYRPIFPAHPNSMRMPAMDTRVSPSSSGQVISKNVQLIPAPNVQEGTVSNTALVGDLIAIPNPPVTTATTTSAGSSPIATTFKAQAITGPLRDRLLGRRNEVSQYKPPSPPTELQVSAVTLHACLGCDDMFINKSSLDYHRSRRSLFIRYKCIVCSSHFLFFNKCLLREHLVLHHRKFLFGTIGLSSAVIIPIPAHLIQMSFNQPTSSTGKETVASTATISPSKSVSERTEIPIGSSTLNKGPQIPGCRKSPLDAAFVTPASTSSAMATPLQTKPLSKLARNSSAPSVTSPQTSSAVPSITTRRGALTNLASKSVTDAKGLPQAPPENINDMIRAVRCVECNELFKDLKLLDVHMHRLTGEPCHATCCPMQLPTVCSLKAHERLHQKKLPHVCPECGRLFRGGFQVLESHLKVHCNHFNRGLMFSCPRCQVSYKRVKPLQQHILDVHAESYFKCLQCPMAFRSQEIFKNHALSHRITPAEISASESRGNNLVVNFEKMMATIFKCPLCDTVFHTEKRQRMHICEHISKQLRLPGFECRQTECNLAFASHCELAEHMFNYHNVLSKGTMCDLCVFSGIDDKEVDAHLLAVHNTSQANTFYFQETTVGIPRNKEFPCSTESNGSKSTNKSDEEGTSGRARKDPQNLSKQIQCDICPATFMNEQELHTHKEAIHGEKVAKRKRNADNKAQRVAPKKLKRDVLNGYHQVETLESLPYHCHLCADRYLQEEELQNHMKRDHSITVQFPCHLCGWTYGSKDELRKHMRAAHEGKRRELPFTCWICKENGTRKAYNKRAHLERHLASQHKMGKSNVDVEILNQMEQAHKCNFKGDIKSEVNSEEDQCAPVLKRLKIDGETQFKCAKCEFVCEDRGQFSEHVLKHKSSRDVLQCRECGMCFMVLPALKIHLKLVHKIHDLKKYADESGVNLESLDAERRVDRLKLKVSSTDDSVASSNENSNDGSMASTSETRLQCTVCYKKYSSKVALKNHMRTHGMAFIRSKRLMAAAILAQPD